MKLLIFIILLTFFYSFAQQNSWQKLNGPVGGEVYGIYAKGDTLLCNASKKGRIFYSTDGGNSWETSNIKLLKVFTDFTSLNNTFFAVAHLNGIYKSENLIDWHKVYSNGKDFWSIGKDHNGNLFAGTDDGKIYSSINEGVTWQLSMYNNNYNDRIVRFLLLNSNPRIFVGAIGKLLKKDLQTNWVPALNNAIGFIRPSADNEDNIYLYSHPNVLKSTDLGETWISKNDSAFINGNYMMDFIYNNRVIAAFDDETSWFGDGWGIALSDDEGATWRWSNNGFPPKFSSCERLIKSGNDTYVGTNAAGVFRSTDFGESWFPVNNGITAATTLDITFDSEGNIYTANWSNGIQKSTDKGLSWKVINNGLTNSYLYDIICDEKDNLMAGTDQGLFRSTNKGENWVQTITAGNDNSFHLFKDRFNRIYSLNYGNGIYRTTNLGFRWQKLNTVNFSSQYVFGFAIDSKDNLYAGTWNGSIYKSTDDGVSWSLLRTSNIYNCVISRIVISSDDIIYATNADEGVLKSTDEGISWTLKNNGLTSLSVHALAVNAKGNLYVSTEDDKFFFSSDKGETWVNVLSNLTLTTVQHITFTKDDKIYLATDESVWTDVPDSVTGTGNTITSKKNYSLEQNYPNPFNPSTTIEYAIKERDLIKLFVYDAFGRIIEVLVNEIKEPGNYSVIFEKGNLASGVYFYRLEAGAFTKVNKMLLLK